MTTLIHYDFPALFLLGGLCVLLKPTYFLMDKGLQNIEKYNKLPLDKRKYVIKNFIKSFQLIIIAWVMMKPLIIPALYHNQWDNRLIHITGAIYTSNDLMGLIMVKKLPYSTKAHHAITTALCLTSFGIDFQTSQLGRMMFVYTLASAHAYLVNFYLGVRLIVEKNKLKLLRISSRNIYFICCLFNWGWHILWVFNNYGIINIGHLMYFMLLFWIVKDDIILLSWLNNTMIKFN